MKKQASQTAKMVAGLRAEAYRWPDSICDDPWAEALAGPEGAVYAAQSKLSFPPMALWIAVRTAYIDALVRAVVKDQDVQQIVILGAGLDSRAARLAKEGVEFFEVDTPESSREKVARLVELDGYPVDAARHVTCDFEREDFVEQLVQSGFKLEEPAFFVWEGVSYYLSEVAVRSTIQRFCRCHPLSLIVFDIFGKRFVERDTGNSGDVDSASLVEEMGEPFRWGTNDPMPLLVEEGCRFVRLTRFDEACLMLHGTYERARMFRFQSFVLAGKQVPSSFLIG